MSFSYNKLWKLLIDKNMMKTELQEAIGMSPATLAKMGKNEPISMNTVGRICKELKCDVGDILEYIEDETD